MENYNFSFLFLWLKLWNLVMLFELTWNSLNSNFRFSLLSRLLLIFSLLFLNMYHFRWISLNSGIFAFNIRCFKALIDTDFFRLSTSQNSFILCSDWSSRILISRTRPYLFSVKISRIIFHYLLNMMVESACFCCLLSTF